MCGTLCATRKIIIMGSGWMYTFSGHLVSVLTCFQVLLQILGSLLMKYVGYVMVFFALSIITVLSLCGFLIVIPHVSTSSSPVFYFHYIIGISSINLVVQSYGIVFRDFSNL